MRLFHIAVLTHRYFKIDSIRCYGRFIQNSKIRKTNVQIGYLMRKASFKHTLTYTNTIIYVPTFERHILIFFFRGNEIKTNRNFRLFVWS